ncbi:hypothetical protein E3D00_08420 [Swingsia samuiensis]|uniref:Uncharacterized protein n=2 Tax=Swingsia samuiensis TaxID=1293412 RepID=A0A4Y6ULY4_9PROT|nr:hypothetical protein E3D00_08420 [Swingsia samuiensis]
MLGSFLNAQASGLQNARLLLGGTLNSTAGQFAKLAAVPYSKSLKLPDLIEITPDLEQDGIRAANLFDANVPTDELCAIVAPGNTLLASLIGDQRVHYDFTRWIPLLTAHSAAIVIVRTDSPHTGLRSRLRNFFIDHSVRLAVSHPTGLELGALLGLTLLGLQPIAVPGYTKTSDALEALKRNEIDAFQVLPYTLDTSLEEFLAQLPPTVAPLYYSGTLPDTFTDRIPNFLEAHQQLRHRTPEGNLYEAWQAVSACAYTALTVALPMLTPHNFIADWVKASSDVLQNSSIQHWAEMHHFALAVGDNASPFLSRATASLNARLALQRWISFNSPRWRDNQETRLF